MQCPPRFCHCFWRLCRIKTWTFRSSTRSKKDFNHRIPLEFPMFDVLYRVAENCCPGPIWPKSLSWCRMRAWMLSSLGFSQDPSRTVDGGLERCLLVVLDSYNFSCGESPLRASRCYKMVLASIKPLYKTSLEDYYVCWFTIFNWTIILQKHPANWSESAWDIDCKDHFDGFGFAICLHICCEVCCCVLDLLIIYIYIYLIYSSNRYSWKMVSCLQHSRFFFSKKQIHLWTLTFGRIRQWR